MKHTTSFDYMLHFIISSIDLFGFSGKNDITDLRLWNLFISRVCSWSVNKHCTLKTIKSFFFFFFSLWNGFILLRTLKKKTVTRLKMNCSRDDSSFIIYFVIPQWVGMWPHCDLSSNTYQTHPDNWLRKINKQQMTFLLHCKSRCCNLTQMHSEWTS